MSLLLVSAGVGKILPSLEVRAVFSPFFFIIVGWESSLYVVTLLLFSLCFEAYIYIYIIKSGPERRIICFVISSLFLRLLKDNKFQVGYDRFPVLYILHLGLCNFLSFYTINFCSSHRV